MYLFEVVEQFLWCFLLDLVFKVGDEAEQYFPRRVSTSLAVFGIT
jgi:hypothetical protein